MTFRIFILTAFISTLLSCNSNSSNQTTIVKSDTTKSSEASDQNQSDTLANIRQYANIIEVKREINKRLAQMFIELDDIMINIKGQRHPTESALDGVVSRVESLSHSVSEILKKIK